MKNPFYIYLITLVCIILYYFLDLKEMFLNALISPGTVFHSEKDFKQTTGHRFVTAATFLVNLSLFITLYHLSWIKSVLVISGIKFSFVLTVYAIFSPGIVRSKTSLVHFILIDFNCSLV